MKAPPLWRGQKLDLSSWLESWAMPIQPYHLAMVTTLVAYELFIMFVLSFCVCSGDVFICSPFLHFPLYRNGVYLFCFLFSSVYVESVVAGWHGYDDLIIAMLISSFQEKKISTDQAGPIISEACYCFYFPYWVSPCAIFSHSFLPHCGMSSDILAVHVTLLTLSWLLSARRHTISPCRHLWKGPFEPVFQVVCVECISMPLPPCRTVALAIFLECCCCFALSLSPLCHPRCSSHLCVRVCIF